MVISSVLIALCASAALGAGKDAAFQQNGPVRSWVVPVAADDPSPTPLPVRITPASAQQSLSRALDAGTMAPVPLSASRRRRMAASESHVTLPSGECALSLSLDHARVPSEAASLRASVRIVNTGSSTVTYTQSALSCICQIVGGDGRVLFDSSRGRLIPHFIMIRHLAPGQSATIAEAVPLRNQDGERLPPGSYTLRARVTIGQPVTLESPFTVDAR
jgi:hypothetical protein